MQSNHLGQMGRGGAEPGVVSNRPDPSRRLEWALTARETEVLAAMATGKTNTAIGAALFISRKAVEKHVNSIFTKLFLTGDQERHPRVQAVLIYLAHLQPRHEPLPDSSDGRRPPARPTEAASTKSRPGWVDQPADPRQPHRGDEPSGQGRRTDSCRRSAASGRRPIRLAARYGRVESQGVAYGG